MSGKVRRQRRRQPVCRRHGPRRPARHRRQRLVALRHLDEGHRHRRQRQHRPHVGLHGADRQPRRARRRRRRARRFASTRRSCSCAARSRASAPTASRRKCAPSTSRRSPSLLKKAGLNGVKPKRVPPLRLGAQALQFQHRQRGRLLMTYHNPPTTPRKSADLRRLHALRDPPRRDDRHLRHPRRRRQAQGSAFRRPAVPRRLDVALPARRLSREVLDRPSRSARATPRSRSSSRSRSPSPA